MPNTELQIEIIKSEAPKAWLDIVECYKKNASELSKVIELDKIPFILQLGIFKEYFSENGVDLDFNNFSVEELVEIVQKQILEHEQVVKHFS
ncbi:MAG: hypothetical protein U0V72_02920 [Cytophagales bacterium]